MSDLAPRLLRAGTVLVLLTGLAACGGGETSPVPQESGETHEFTNRLIREKSPYLLQHAHNPVDWYPWGPEALEVARREDRPIFLSVGYSTCHWCHVMGRESFENEEIAALLNEFFVPVKVDREERPDVDNLYMSAVQAMNQGRGGWPMSVFLTPEGKPFFGGTYFPPADFRTLLGKVRIAWADRREDLLQDGDQLSEYLSARFHAASTDTADRLLGPDLLTAAYRSVQGSYDEPLGGFGDAPKFPTPHKITFLLRYAQRTGDIRAGEMARGTLDAMAAGGIYDHLGGGFHRYSTDRRWLVPHFEKMLYDQAGLALAYLSAWLVFGEESHKAVSRGVLDYVLRDLQRPGGGFYAAEDADSEGKEGTYYVWSAGEIDSLLGPETGPKFRGVYRTHLQGNWQHTNILHVEALTPDVLTEWSEERTVLFQARAKRPRPHRDEKIIVAWNGYIIEALARAGAALENSAYVEAAAEAATFILENLWPRGRLQRHYRDGTARIPGYLDDYAFLGRGLLALYEATFDPRWLRESLRVAEDLHRLFARPEGGYALAGSDAERLLAPVVESHDGAFPSGNSAAALLFLRLGHLTAREDLKERGWGVLRTFAPILERSPAAHLEMLSAMDFALGPNREVVVAGEAGDPRVVEMKRALWDRYLPNAVLAFRPATEAEEVVRLIPYLEVQTALEGRATAYVCRDYTCRLPVHDAGALGKLLGETGAGAEP